MKERFRAEGRELVVGGDTPISLEDPDRLWWVETGEVEIFSVAQGARSHFLTLHPGDLLMGFGNNQPSGRKFMAVGHQDTRLREMALQQFRQWAALDTMGEMVAQWLDRWVGGVGSAVSRDINPRTDQTIQAGSAIVEASSSFRAHKGVIWLKAQEVPSLVFLDMEDVPTSSDLFFPLTRDTRIHALEGGTIHAFTTLDLLKRDELWTGLACFLEVVGRCEDMNQRLATADELNRIRERQAWNRRITDETFQELRTVIAPQPSVFDPQAATEPLLAACRIVGRRMGIEIRKPPNWQQPSEHGDLISDIALASRIRCRPVSLEGEWWNQDHGDLVAFLKEGMKPLALLQKSPGTYEFHDPEMRRVDRVDSENSTQLHTEAFMFYSSLPDRPLGLVDLLKFGVQGCRQDALIMMAMAAAGGLMTAMVPLSTRYLFETVIPGADRTRLLFIPISLLCLALAFLSFQFSRNFAKLRMETRLDIQIQAALMDRLLVLPSQFFRQYASGDLATRITGLATAWPAISSIMAMLLLSLFSGLFNTLTMFSFDFRLGLIGLGLILTGLIPGAMYLKFQSRHFREMILQESRLTSVVLQLLGGISKIRSAGAEVPAFANWGRNFSALRRRKILALFHGAWFKTFSQSFPLFCQILLFGFMASLFFSHGSANLEHTVSIGEFLAFVAAFTNVLMVTLGFTVASAQGAMISPVLDRLRPILKATPEVNDTKRDPGKLAGAIELSHLSYRYRPELPLVLKDVSFCIQPGEYVAIVGPSGSGKSTLLRLLLGFDSPETGSIQYDGQDLNHLDPSSLRRQIGTVIQNGRPMPGSILENVRGIRSLSLDQCWEALRLAGLEREVRDMPMGIHSLVSSSGQFSGGQLQRMMIARALAGKPRLIFFDEATSALDNRVQAHVIRALQEMQATRLVIAHRLSTVVQADRIIVLQDGCKVQEGSFQELLHQPGLFAELAQRQMLQPDTKP